MEELSKLIPNSIISLIGLAAIMSLLVILGTLLQEWGKSIWRRSTLAGKEKRHETNYAYDGIERRAENKDMRHTLITMMEGMAEQNNEMKEFVRSLRVAHEESQENIDQIRRTQERNWKRLFDDELPQIRAR